MNTNTNIYSRLKIFGSIQRSMGFVVLMEKKVHFLSSVKQLMPATRRKPAMLFMTCVVTILMNLQCVSETKMWLRLKVNMEAVFTKKEMVR